MVNSVQKALGYRDILYNVKQDKFVTYAEGDNYKILNISTGGGGGGGRFPVVELPTALVLLVLVICSGIPTWKSSSSGTAQSGTCWW